MVEHKPAGAALHYRQASEEDAAAALAAVREGPARLPGVHAREGKQVIELAVVEADKGYALDAIRHQVGRDGGDLRRRRRDRRGCLQPAHRPRSRHQGRARAPTFATQRVEGPDDVARLLARLRREPPRVAGRRQRRADRAPRDARRRQDRRARDARTPASPGCAIRGPTARRSSPSSWAAAPADRWPCGPRTTARPTAQRYLDGTLTLETRWAGLTVCDYLDRGEPYGRVRLVRVLEGSAEAIVEFTPRPDFGRTPIGLRAEPDGVVVLGRSRSGRALRAGARVGDRGRRRAGDGASAHRRRPAVRDRAALRQRQPGSPPHARARAPRAHRAARGAAGSRACACRRSRAPRSRAAR